MKDSTLLILFVAALALTGLVIAIVRITKKDTSSNIGSTLQQFSWGTTSNAKSQGSKTEDVTKKAENETKELFEKYMES